MTHGQMAMWSERIGALGRRSLGHIIRHISPVRDHSPSRSIWLKSNDEAMGNARQLSEVAGANKSVQRHPKTIGPI